ncbi:unnamed protein product, partial [Prorocentrum cordatum]
EENYGVEDVGAAPRAGLLENFGAARRLLAADAGAGLLCAVVACFEGSMYAFVFNWTPALRNEASKKKPHQKHTFSEYCAVFVDGHRPPGGAATVSAADPKHPPDPQRSDLRKFILLPLSLLLSSVSFSRSSPVHLSLWSQRWLIFS